MNCFGFLGVILTVCWLLIVVSLRVPRDLACQLLNVGYFTPPRATEHVEELGAVA